MLLTFNRLKIHNSKIVKYYYDVLHFLAYKIHTLYMDSLHIPVNERSVLMGSNHPMTQFNKNHMFCDTFYVIYNEDAVLYHKIL